MAQRTKIDGLDGVMANLKKLEGKEAKKVVRSSLRAGAKPLRNEAKAKAKKFDDPATDNAVWKQIATRSIKQSLLKRRDFTAGVTTGVKDSKPGEPYEYARYLEKGTSSMAAQPFMRPAIDMTKDTVFRAVSDELWAGISKQLTLKG